MQLSFSDINIVIEKVWPVPQKNCVEKSVVATYIYVLATIHKNEF
jgi:hypothetical protein